MAPRAARKEDGAKQREEEIKRKEEKAERKKEEDILRKEEIRLKEREVGTRKEVRKTEQGAVNREQGARLSPQLLNQVPENRVASQVSVPLSHGGMIEFGLPILQPMLQPPTLAHHILTLPIPAAPRVPTASSNRLRRLFLPLPYSDIKGAGPGTATSSSDGSDRTFRSASDTTSPRRQHRDGSSSRASRGHKILGNHTLTKTLGNTGKVILVNRNVKDEKVLVIPSLPIHLSSSSFFLPFSHFSVKILPGTHISLPPTNLPADAAKKASKALPPLSSPETPHSLYDNTKANSKAPNLNFQERDQAEANKEENARGKEELQRIEEEARRKEHEAKQKEQEAREKEEWKKKDEEVRKRETEVRKHEEEVRKREAEVKKHEEEVRKHEEQVKKRQEEMRKYEEEVKKRAEEAQQKELEVKQKNEALDVGMVCARLFILLQAPESSKKLVCPQEHQAQEMMDDLQKVRLAFIAPHHVHMRHLHDYLY